MMISSFPPGAILIFGALLLPFLGPRIRSVFTLALPLATLWLVWNLPNGTSDNVHMFDYELVLVQSDALGRLFAIIFSLMAFAGGLFALRQKNVLEIVSALVYAGSAVGVVLAGDLITLFVFWEIMALASSIVIMADGGERLIRVTKRYFIVHIFGGSLLMTGIVMHVASTGSIALTSIDPGTMGGTLILAGVLLNAAGPPLSAWLPDAYPEASYSGTVFLSAFTTKAAVYVLIRSFPGTEVLIWVGLFMIFYGIIYALLENDMRRILAYSIVNQVGFMVVGVGIGTEMALNGASAHAFAHIIYKALLMMSAGAVLYQTGKRKCTELGGLFQSMPITTLCGIVGALSISSFPWTSGFVSKSMISQSAGDAHLAITWFLLLAASAGVFLHAGIKFPWFVFFQKDSGMRPPDPPWHMRLAMIFFAMLCIGIGIWPDTLYVLLPYAVDYVPYTSEHVVHMLQLLLFSGLAFFLMLPLMRRTLTITIDVDWFYRRFGPRALETVVAKNAGARNLFLSVILSKLNQAWRLPYQIFGSANVLMRNSIGNMLLMVLVALSIVLILGLFLG